MKTNIRPQAPLKLIAALIAVATLSTACSSTAVKKSAAPETATTGSAPVSMTYRSDIDSGSVTEPAAPIATAELQNTVNEPVTDDVMLTTSATGTTDDSSDIDLLTPRPARTVFQFGFNQSTLDADSQKIVEIHGRFLAEHPDQKIILNGHSDSQGDSRYNEALSLKRAEYVADILMSQGATRDQIEMFSWGAAAPLANAEHNRDNRRVELLYAEEYLVHSDSGQIDDDEAEKL